MNKFIKWLIKKLGGYTQIEVDNMITENQKLKEENKKLAQELEELHNFHYRQTVTRSMPASVIPLRDEVLIDFGLNRAEMEEYAHQQIKKDFMEAIEPYIIYETDFNPLKNAIALRGELTIVDRR